MQSAELELGKEKTAIVAMAGEIGWNSMAKITESLINVVMMNKLKLLKGLTQNGITIG